MLTRRDANWNWQEDLKSSLLDDHFMRVGQLLTALLDVPISLLSVIDGDLIILHSADDGLSSRFVCPIPVVVDEPILRGQTVAINKNFSNEHRPDELVIDEKVQSCLKAPVMLDGQPVAVLCVMDYRPREWRNDEKAHLENLAKLIATEFALRRAQLRIHFESNLVETVLESMQDEVIITNTQGAYLRVNAAARDRFGDSRYDALDSFPDDFRWHDSQGRPLDVAELPLQQTLVSNRVVRQELLLKTASDPVGRWISCQSSPILGPKGAILGAVWVSRDISEGRNRSSEIPNSDLEDPLTHLPTGRGLMLLAEHLCALARRERADLTLICFELTSADQLSNSGGNVEAESHLLGFARILKRNLRGSDLFARTEPNRFVMMAIGAQPEPLLKRLAKALSQKPDNRYQLSLKVTQCAAESCPCKATEEGFGALLKSGFEQMTLWEYE